MSDKKRIGRMKLDEDEFWKGEARQTWWMGRCGGGSCSRWEHAPPHFVEPPPTSSHSQCLPSLTCPKGAKARRGWAGIEMRWFEFKWGEVTKWRKVKQNEKGQCCAGWTMVNYEAKQNRDGVRLDGIGHYMAMWGGYVLQDKIGQSGMIQTFLCFCSERLAIVF